MGKKEAQDDEMQTLMKNYRAPIIPPADIQHPDPKALKNMASTPKWLIQWCILKSSTGCHKCHQKLQTLQRYEAAETKRKAELERIRKKNEIIASHNQMIQARIDMMQARVDMEKAEVERQRIENELQKRTPYLLDEDGPDEKNSKPRRTSSWKSIFDKPLFGSFAKKKET